MPEFGVLDLGRIYRDADAYKQNALAAQMQQMQIQKAMKAQEDENALAQIFQKNYQPDTQKPEMYQPQGPMQDGTAMPAVPTGNMTGSPGGMNMRGAINEMYQRFPQQAMQFEQNMRKQQGEPYSLGEIGAGNDQVQSVVFNKATGKFEPVGDTRRKSSMPDWMMPGYLDTQKKLAEAKGEGRMSATVQKELFEADEGMQSASNVIGLLSKAKEINKSAMYGPYASTRAKAVSLLPGESQKANATIDLDNIMTGQALESLKLIFGGMPTEGERKILLDMQASVDKTPAQREAILDRAVEIANRRMSFNKSKADSLRSGTYFKEGPAISQPQIGGAQQAAPTQPPATSGQIKNIGGRTYVNINGKWYAQ